MDRHKMIECKYCNKEFRSDYLKQHYDKKHEKDVEIDLLRDKNKELEEKYLYIKNEYKRTLYIYNQKLFHLYFPNEKMDEFLRSLY